MRFKKVIAIILTITTAMLTATTALAAGKDNDSKTQTEANYKAFTGTVKEITKAEYNKDTTYVLVENEKGEQANIIITKDTCHINDDKIEKGSRLTGYYDANAMTIMIYPPQYEAIAVMVVNKELIRKVDYFNKDLISADYTLKLNVGKDTIIQHKDGRTFKGELGGRRLLVFYDISTRSIPAQTTPKKIVVLSEQENPPAESDKQTYYNSFTGIVKEITKPDKSKEVTKVLVKNQGGAEAYFIITDATYRVNKEEITVGSEITGYYDAKAMYIMIYPPQFPVEVLVVKEREHNVKIDYFDKNLLSSDGTLKLDIDKNTPVIRKGKKFKGNISKNTLIVIYDEIKKSNPPIAEPIKVIVLTGNNDGPKSASSDKPKQDHDKPKHDSPWVRTGYDRERLMNLLWQIFRNDRNKWNELLKYYNH